MREVNHPADGEIIRYTRRRVLTSLTMLSGAAAFSSLTLACSGAKVQDRPAAEVTSSAPPIPSGGTPAPAPAGATAADAARQRYLIDVFETNFGEQMRAQPKAWRGKFRKMASGTFPFYRGSAAVYYTDLAGEGADPFVTTESSRVWIQGDLHGDNFGTFLDSTGRLVFDVNDFDEAYVGPYTWDVRRFATSMALVGYDQSLADDQIRDLIAAFVNSYTAQVNRFATGQDDRNFALTLENAEGVVLDVLRTARRQTREGLLDGLTEVVDGERRFVRNDVNSSVDDKTRSALEATFASYLKVIPEQTRRQERDYRIKDSTATQGFGIGSAGLRMFSLLLEGSDETLDNDVILAVKQSRPSAVAIAVKDQNIKDAFSNQGQRVATARRAMQVNADPWLGYSEFEGAGMLVSEVSPYGASPQWSDIKNFDDVRSLVKDLGRVVAKIHCVADKGSDQKLVTGPSDKAILASFAGKEGQFVTAIADWAQAYAVKTRTDHRLFADAFRNREFPSLGS
ncbi:MAG: DUF2252 domain-containing protein [Mycobacterium sp.]|nr:DUF2252 domain-containing protein [Mycobacterium sp.]